MTRKTRGLVALACALWVSASAAEAAPGEARVRLAVQEPARVEGVGELRVGGVLRLYPVHPGHLVVKVGERVLVDCSVGWGEAERMMFEVVEWLPHLPPQVVNGEPGKEELAVELPEEVEPGEEVVELSYEWHWRYEGRPTLERRWRRVLGEEQARQQAAARAFEEEFPLGEEDSSEPEWEPSPEDESEEAQWLGDAEELLRPQVDANQPEVLRVWAYTSRAQVAEQLFGAPGAVGDFDYEACEGPPGSAELAHSCVRVRQVEALRPPLRAQVQQALEALLKREETWLRTWAPGEAQALALAERSLAWAQRAEVKDEQGRSYFDRYLALLADKRGEQEGEPEWNFLGSHSEQLMKAVALRAQQWQTRYQIEDGSPRLKPGDVVGRVYYSRSLPERRFSVAVRVLKLLVEEESQARAEIRLRNGRWQGLRVLVPGKDGLWRGYAAELVSVEGNERLEQQERRLYGYYPGTLFIRPEERRLGIPGRGDAEEGLRRQLLEAALKAATAKQPHALLGLDAEVLELLSAEERQRLLELLLTGPGLGLSVAQEGVELVTRVVVSTPEEDFAALERGLMRPDILNRLLSLEGPQQALLGQAFTLKALAAAPLKLESVETLPSFHLGRQGEESHLLNVPLEQGASGETLLRFRPVRLSFEARYFSSNEEGPTSQPLRAREWVRVELHGPEPETRLVTALELALRASDLGSELVWAAVGRISETHVVYGGVSGLARALPLGAGAAAGGSAAAAAARTAAVKTFAGRLGLVAVLATVDSHREELSRTEAGRNFLLVHDLALLGLAARDVSKLFTSGVLQEWARRAAAVLSQLGDKASMGLRESLEAAQALTRAVEKVLAEGKVAATQQGLTFNTPEGARTLRQAWFSVRGEMAAERALAGLRQAGALTPEVERALSTLRSLGEQSEAWAQAWSAVARRAAALPAQEARQYLEAVEALRAVARPTAQLAVAKLLCGSASRAPSQALTFLKEAEWMVQRAGLEEEALAVLARKAEADLLDLRWLGSTGLTVEDLNFLGKDVRTPWTVFKKAAEQPGSRKIQILARRLLRGIAGELVTERSAQALFSDYKVTGRQVLLPGKHIIDFELQVLEVLKAAGAAIRHALEVKGWTADTWRRALAAWNAHSMTGARLDSQQQQLVKQLQRLVAQLKDAARPPRGRPFLVCTDRLDRKTVADLERFLSDNLLEVEIVSIRELDVAGTARRLRVALNLPERLPGKKTGGTP